MNAPVAVPLPRCCPEHHDWATLAKHLVVEFTDVPGLAVIRELRWARQAGELFSLELADALDCAELIVRQRVSSTPTGGARHPAASATSAASRRARLSPRHSRPQSV